MPKCVFIMSIEQVPGVTRSEMLQYVRAIVPPKMTVLHYKRDRGQHVAQRDFEERLKNDPS